MNNDHSMRQRFDSSQNEGLDPMSYERPPGYDSKENSPLNTGSK